MPKSLAVFYKSRLLQSISVLAIASVTSIGGAHAQAANVTPVQRQRPQPAIAVPGLNATAAGQNHAADNLVAGDQRSTTAPSLAAAGSCAYQRQEPPRLGLEHRHRRRAAITASPPTSRAACRTSRRPTGGTVPGIQPVGGYGATLGAIYDHGVNAYAAGNHSALPNMVNLLSTAYTVHQLRPRRRPRIFFANGASNGTTTDRRADRLHPADLQRPAQHDQQRLRPRLWGDQHGARPGRLRQLAAHPGQAAHAAPHQPSIRPRSRASRPIRRSRAATRPTPSPTASCSACWCRSSTRACWSRGGRIRQQPHRARRALSARHHREPGARELRPRPGLHQPGLHQQRRDDRHGDQPADARSPQPGAGAQQLPLGRLRRHGRDLRGERAKRNPYVPSAANEATYAQRLTYGLPTLTFEQAPHEAAPAGGPDASILLAHPLRRQQRDGEGARQRRERRHERLRTRRQPLDQHDQPDHRQHRDQRARRVLRDLAQLLDAHQSLRGRRLFPGRHRRPYARLERCGQDGCDDRRRQARWAGPARSPATSPTHGATARSSPATRQAF